MIKASAGSSAQSSKPERIAERKSRKGKARENPGTRLGHVLIVEDEALLAAAIEETLRGAGATSVDVCSTTEAALAALNKNPPDVLILDVNLADRSDGWAIAELVAELNPRQPQIVFSTGSPERIPPAIAELGSVLAKPYAPEDLIAVLGPAPGLIDRLRGAMSTS